MTKRKKAHIISASFAGVFSGLAYCIRGRRKNRKVVDFTNQTYAHRGFHKFPDIPENSMKAFEEAYRRNLAIEIDVHLLKDGSVVVFHDSKLERMCGVEGMIEDMTYEEVSKLRLNHTEEHIPLLTELLSAHEYTYPFLIEIKTRKNNGKALTKAVCEIMDGFPNISYCMQSFDPRVLIWLKKHRPEIVRGQLSSDFLQEKGEGLNVFTSFVLANLLTNIATKPDFVSYNFHYRNKLAVKIAKIVWHMPVFNWTIRTREDMITTLMDKNTVIFEGFDPKR